MLYSVQHLEKTIYELRIKLIGRPTKEAHQLLKQQNKELRAQLKAAKAEIAILLKERESRFLHTLNNQTFTPRSSSAKSRS